ncbi:MAG: hypothetical protein INR72_00515 [Williamsia herbipolensis]|uniref:Uncharacterized protein n=1 Tax=Williamsia serinedens TaxID=391736 RepID=A0ABT1GY81_9NOCA|nr:hypothetical protein [Williamsia serinedens]MBE7159697.1 hypothetical protein [Williamsia herbipolensis]MCP2159355.1 hypothetical protein [Williamsia serinedens]
MTIDPDATDPDAGALPVDSVPDKPVPEGAEGDVLEQEFVVDVDDDEYPHAAEVQED